MRRITAIISVLCLLLALGGCGGGTDAMQQALDLRTAILDAGGCTFAASVTANLGDTVCQFGLDCQFSPQTGTRLTVKEPEEIAGLTADVAADGVTVSFDGALLVFGPLAAGLVSALTGPSLAAGAWTQEYIRDAGLEDGAVRFTCLTGFDEAELQIDTWLDERGLPCRCEISSSGTLILACQITDFQCG